MKRIILLRFVACGLFLLFSRCATDNPSDIQDTPPDDEIRINQPPQILSLTTESDTVRIHEMLLCTCTAEDPDGDSLSYEWGAFKATESSTIDDYELDLDLNRGTMSSTGNQAVWSPGLLEGKYIVFCKVTDIAGFEALEKKLIHVSFERTLHVTTDQISYLPSDTIYYTIENLQYDRVFFENCGLEIVAHTEQRIDSMWINVTEPFGCIAIGIPVPVDLNRSYTTVAWTIPWSLEMGMMSGTYHLFVKYHFPDSGSYLNEVLYSNEFEVVEL